MKVSLYTSKFTIATMDVLLWGGASESVREENKVDEHAKMSCSDRIAAVRMRVRRLA